MTFEDLKFTARPNELEGVQALVFFPNGFGALVVRGFGTYGASQGLWGLAVVRGTEENWNLCYTSGITNDVLGHLTAKAVTKVLGRIEALAPRGEN